MQQLNFRFLRLRLNATSDRIYSGIYRLTGGFSDLLPAYRNFES